MTFLITAKVFPGALNLDFVFSEDLTDKKSAKFKEKSEVVKEIVSVSFFFF